MNELEYTEWSQELGSKTVEEFSKKSLGSSIQAKKLIENWNPNPSDFIDGLKSSQEDGNKDAYYRAYGYSLMPLAEEYYSMDVNFVSHNEHKGVHRKLFYALNNCKVFSPSDDLFELLQLTDVKGEILANPPYPSTFISKVWETENNILWGCSITRCVSQDNYNKEKWGDKDIKPLTFTGEIKGYEDEFFVAVVPGYNKKADRTFTAEAVLPTTDSSDLEIDFVEASEDFEDTLSDEEKDLEFPGFEDDSRKMIKTVLGLFHFINSPNVEYVKDIDRDVRDKGNRKRLGKGKMPSPSHSVVTVDGQTKRYLDAVKEREGDDLRSLHWVRGHFRVLRDEDYWGDRAGERIWVRPHMKGDGDLIEQEYEVKKNE